MILREARLAAERLLVDRRTQALGERDERRPALVRVERARPTTSAGRSARSSNSASAATDSVSTAAGPKHAPRRGVLVRLAGLFQPVAHRHDHERRPAPSLGLVVRALDRAGTSCARTGCSTQTG